VKLIEPPGSLMVTTTNRRDRWAEWGDGSDSSPFAGPTLIPPPNRFQNRKGDLPVRGVV
jgi:hypothetical protein